MLIFWEPLFGPRLVNYTYDQNDNDVEMWAELDGTHGLELDGQLGSTNRFDSMKDSNSRLIWRQISSGWELCVLKFCSTNKTYLRKCFDEECMDILDGKWRIQWGKVDGNIITIWEYKVI